MYKVFFLFHFETKQTHHFIQDNSINTMGRRVKDTKAKTYPLARL